MKIEQIKALAEKSWEKCHGCDDSDKNFWINGFTIGYLNAQMDNIDHQIKLRQYEMAEVLINGDNCEYSGLPSVQSYESEDKTFKQKSKWTKVNKQR